MPIGDPELGCWVKNQRENWRKQILSHDREQLLRSVGFEFQGYTFSYMLYRGGVGGWEGDERDRERQRGTGRDTERMRENKRERERERAC